MSWPKLIEYGQATAVVAIVLSLLGLAAVAKRSRHFRPRRPIDWIGSLAAVGVICFAVIFLRWAAPLKSVFREANRPAPDFEFRLLADNSSRRLSDYRDKVIVLNIWATWCAPCRAEMPALDRLQQQHGKDGLVVIVVSDEPSEQIAKFTGLDQMQFVKGRVDAGYPRAGLYIPPGVRPVTHIIDQGGILRETLIGDRDYASFESTITPYLNLHR